jgi:hypothetical protein
MRKRGNQFPLPPDQEDSIAAKLLFQKFNFDLNLIDDPRPPLDLDLATNGLERRKRQSTLGAVRRAVPPPLAPRISQLQGVAYQPERSVEEKHPAAQRMLEAGPPSLNSYPPHKSLLSSSRFLPPPSSFAPPPPQRQLELEPTRPPLPDPNMNRWNWSSTCSHISTHSR